MNITSDLVLAAILILAAVIGRKRGFVKTVFGLFGSVIAFVASFFLCRPFGSFLEEKIFLPRLSERFLSSLEEVSGTVRDQLNFSSLPETSGVSDLLKRFGTNASAVSSAASGQSTAQAVAEKVVSPFSHMISIAAAFFIVFIAVTLLLKLAEVLLDLVAKIPGLKFSNHLLGLIAGLVWGVLLVAILSALLSELAPFIQSAASPFFRDFDPEKTFLLRFFRHFDFLGAVRHVLNQ